MRRVFGLRSAIALLIVVFGLAGLAVASAPQSQAAGPSFVDAPASHPYVEAIEGLAQQGIVGGYERSDGQFEFRPGDPVRRAQFAKIIVGAMGLEVKEEEPYLFADLGADDPNNLYPHEFVGVAARYGITTGTGPSQFAPYLDIKRAQLLTMAVRAAQRLRPGALVTPPAGFRSYVGDFDPTHGPALRIAEYNGLLNGIQGYGWHWDPWAKASRGEAAQILWNLMAPPGPGSTTTLPPTTTTTVVGTKVAKLTASVSNSSPLQYSDVTAYAKVTDSAGRVVRGASVSFTWNYKTVAHTMSATTNSSGVASVTRGISGATKGYRVVINVKASGGGGSASTSTSFTPR